MRNKSVSIHSFVRAVGRSILIIFWFCYVCLSFIPNASAATLEHRLEKFPQWTDKPPVKIAKEDLQYPAWMAGTWNVTSTLIEQVAPLAPKIVSPGFKDNQSYLDRPIAFQVRFGDEYSRSSQGLFSILKTASPGVVADRAFNGQKIAEAYLGKENVYRVKVAPDNPNQQITLLKGDRRLISRITGRTSEMPQEDRFIAAELTQQLFRSPERLYLNEVETTSSYRLVDFHNITAEQITAIYLSPQDPDYFTAGDRPVALYRYHLDLFKEE